jgi:hypothetical protein
VTSSTQIDRMIERITTHLRAHVAEVRNLERACAAPGEIEERRELIARLQSQLAGLVESALTPRPDRRPRSAGAGVGSRLTRG